MPSTLTQQFRSISISRDNEVPHGFVNWLKALERIRSEIFQEVEDCLMGNDVFSAVGIFKEEAAYNPLGVWH